MEYCESLPVQALVHMVKAQNHLETDFHYLEENGTLVNGSESSDPKSGTCSKEKGTARCKPSQKNQHPNQTYQLQRKQVIEPDMSPMENRVFNRRQQFKMDDILKLYDNDKDKIEEWIYLVETESENGN
ncbi:hypothetical protein BpHYR1_046709 [Brachionus plicatilis]|uniref:Uncharacterized protein n=1 Tax=Brachionus plicatilis TaxID=10195 RepID=A0A3M7PN03_BRAPC|nr:hypothetical protein BpHYR1_046709 [Brachionus plicatilis]